MEVKKKNLWSSIGRAVLGHCPNCGQGRLFKSYLKQVDSCQYCSEEFGHIRADDGPAWLTIVLVGHIMAPFIVMYAIDSAWPVWLSVTVWSAFAVTLMLVLLPRSKGLFIAIIWRMQCSGGDKS